MRRCSYVDVLRDMVSTALRRTPTVGSYTIRRNEYDVTRIAAAQTIANETLLVGRRALGHG